MTPLGPQAAYTTPLVEVIGVDGTVHASSSTLNPRPLRLDFLTQLAYSRQRLLLILYSQITCSELPIQE
jgi:hypothetical protein